MSILDDRRRMMVASLGKKREYIFQEGAGLVWGNYYAYAEGTYGTTISSSYINLCANTYTTVGSGSSGDGGSYVYGTLIALQPITLDSYSYIEAGSGFDFSKYKKLCFEAKNVSGSTSNYYQGRVGYRQDTRLSKSSLRGKDARTSAFSSNKYVVGSARQIYEFDISSLGSGYQIVLESPYERNRTYIYNIWLE